MSRSHAVREGFSAIFREPAVYLAELAWRWTFGIAATLLSVYAVLLFLHSLPVSDRDLFGLSGIIPGLYGQALAHIFQGSGPKMVRVVILLSLGLSFLWFLAASFGRAATLRALLCKERAGIFTVFRLHFLRVMVGIAAWIAYVGAFAMAASASRFENGSGYDPGTFYAIFLAASFAIGTAWSSASWYLSLGPIFAVRNETGTLDSLYDAAAMIRFRASQFTWVGIFFGSVRLLLWFGAFSIFLAAMSATAQAPSGVGTVVFVLFVATYSASSNFLNMSRLAAYLRIVEWDEEDRMRPPEVLVVPSALPPPRPLLDPPIVPAM